MAKTGVCEKDETVAPKALELKEKLQGLANTIVDGDDIPVGIVDEAIKILSSLKDFKLKMGLSQKLDDLAVPPEFRCPISRELMKDPVILATGQVRVKAYFMINGFF